ncbi:hypothetical protein CEXT_181981 [Caerostris extrusa]|uniref:C2H2-type domain-containing protein n=1 Tax=Caerostris extrusa TaxID=172846 RepID=A0AAV4Y3S4_CAEEX|nr:hypothetical protein CEXT_181981 [Caerostris extrusa]
MNVCEFCNAYIANFEVHSCRKYRNQHRQSSATLPRSSSDIKAQDIDSVSAQQTDYEAQRPFDNQSNSSTKQSFLPDVHQRIDCGETAGAETFSQRVVTNQNLYNPETSDFLFPDWPHDQERQFESTHLQQPSEVNSAILNENPQCCGHSNPEQSANTALPVAETCILPGFQQTFGRRNALTNQMAHPPNTSCQMECPGISRTDEMSTHFISDFNDCFNASANRIAQQCDTSSSIPILTTPNAQNNLMDPIPPIDAIGPIHSDKCPEEFLPRGHLEPDDRSRSVARPYVCNYCAKTFSYNSTLTTHIRTHTREMPHTCMVCNQCFADSSDLTKHMDIHTGRTSHKCTECDKCFSRSSTLLEHVRAFHSGENPNKCTECSKYFAHPSSLLKHIRSIHIAVKPCKCTECGQFFPGRDSLIRHIRNIHTAEKVYKCSECSRCFSRRDKLREHVRKMHTDG